ncbi:anti-sigma factor [Nitritalea halalkaliphila LW7]|uniref:Anti-sigma factor n=1 Tax=Nitritalea halalkaliphila LW7 TaxID=1189621 RepID=I5BZW6_9BACT|nr:FecR domain-containing protein [Nitritalea halalkaliphila]EIM75118.1 anti-sigma factor [Nitritalea halalkaliphila LW7]
MGQHWKDIWRGFFSSEPRIAEGRREQLWEEIARSVRRERQREYRRLFLKWAAVFVALLAAVAVLYVHLVEDLEEERFWATLQEEVGDQEFIALDLGQEEQLTFEEREKYFDFSGDAAEGSAEEAKPLGKAQNHVLTVPYGRRATVKLADGSKVWLNAGSRLVYPSHFEEGQRKVYLSGEAFFEVVADASRPFRVEMEDTAVDVLGTAFNVRAYPDEQRNTTVLVHGSVRLAAKARRGEVESLTLNPSQLAVHQKGETELRVKSVDTAPYLSWKDGYMMYRKTNFTRLSKDLKRYYNVEIQFSEPNLALETISGRLDLRQDIEEVLHFVTAASDLNYKRIGTRKVLIYRA